MSYHSMCHILYNRTKNQITFNVEDFRGTKLHEKFDHPNQIGHFFRKMRDDKLIIEVDRTRAAHKKAKGRSIAVYVWSAIAHHKLNY